MGEWLGKMADWLLERLGRLRDRKAARDQQESEQIHTDVQEANEAARKAGGGGT